ncbi:PTS system oligo-beta-mannoside-specific EIIC component [uncultured Eubacterium sp.]|nr:PTS system oligo-beta-mannoside-specific EIIC component [uncultured Eubacterium sp.]
MGKLDKIFERIENNTLINVIRNGFVAAIPFLLMGAFSLMITSLPITPYQNFITEIWNGRVYAFFDSIYDYTICALSLILLITISYYYAKYYDAREPSSYPIISVISYVVFVGMGMEPAELNITIFSQMWTLTAVMIALLSSAIYHQLLEKVYKRHGKNIYRSSKGSTKFVYLIIPSVVTIGLFGLASVVLEVIFGAAVSQNVLSALAMELFENLGRNFGSSVLFIFLVHFMWMFGIHGSNVLDDVATTLFADRWGEVFSKTFFDTFVLMGGSGTAISLLIAILLFMKNKGKRRLAKLSFLPVLFNVNETLIFGLPVIFNPVLLVPFVLTPVITLITSTAAVSLDFVPVVNASVNWTTPVILSGYLTTGSIAGSLLQIFNICIGVLIYMPFVRVLEKPYTGVVKENIDTLVDYVKEMESIGVVPSLTKGTEAKNKAARRLLSDMHTAIEDGQLRLFYQPQVDDKGRLIGVEGLLRWKHPACGYIYPPLLLYLAVEDDYLHELELIVLNCACKDIGYLKAQGLDGLKVSINISAMQLDSQKFYDDVEKNLKRYDLGQCKLAFEITERVALSGTQRVRQGLQRLEANGIGIIMDDFGMGYSSMSYLQNSNFDYVKLDGSLVREISVNPRSKEIVKTICQLSEKLNFEVIAEYVETEEQRDLLRSLGCRIYQGYFYGKAMPLEELIAWSENYII